MKQKYETDITFADNIHKILALAFLDPNAVATGFEFLCTNLGNEYQEILDYIEDNYIGLVRRTSRIEALFSINFWNMVVCVKTGMHPTNNHVEAWHRKLNCAFQAAHPTLWLFLDKLIKEENTLYFGYY